jgi:7,8-dihydropterin-6-yl-methyl-4-(beta-D-ribofuranosyl)aminobenzene 5'-phosphate synthase
MKIITLIENSRPEKSKLKAQHGLSFYIEWKDSKILFDTGQNGAFTKNARKLDVDLSSIDYCVVSHAHYDHGGGLKAFLQHNRKAPVYLKESCREKYYTRLPGNTYKSIGLDINLLDRNEERMRYVNDRQRPSPGVLLLSPKNFNSYKPRGNTILYMHRGGEYLEDLFDHELMMVLHDEEELILFTGCAHSGIINMIKTVQQEFPDRTITAVLGGLHTMRPKRWKPGETEEEIGQVGEELDRMDIEVIYTGHCTGSSAFQILQSLLGEKLIKLSTGLLVQ